MGVDYSDLAIMLAQSISRSEGFEDIEYMVSQNNCAYNSGRQVVLLLFLNSFIVCPIPPDLYGQSTLDDKLTALSTIMYITRQERITCDGIFDRIMCL